MASPISTPKGGGAQSGLGEKFSPDLFTGTGNFSVPIALPPGRNGFQPELGLQYSTGSGNSPFGLGWNLSVPGVMRKTAKGVPRYDDEKDTFILSGAEDLVAVRKIEIRDNQQNEAGVVPLQNERGFATQYRPRTEGLFARIYHLKTNLRNCWKVMSKDGLVSWYGSKTSFENDLSLVQKPDHVTSVFAWKLTFTEDTFGNHIRYTYEKEQVRENDYHRWDQNYLKEIKYSDYSLTPGSIAYMVKVLFSYENRSDAFSDYKSGFDIRTTKRCRDIQIFTNPTSGEIKTRTYHFQYSDEILPAAEQPFNGASLLCKMEVEGHDGTASEFLPPLEFRYTHFKPAQQKFKKLEGSQMPLTSLASPGFELIDLFGNGLPDIVEISGVVRYWRNLGNGKFDAPRTMKEAPAGITLASPDVQLIDANGDGRTDLLVNGTQMSGYYSMKHNASWDTKSFKKYRQAPSFSFADPEVKLMDLTGDGVTDVLRNGSAFECFFQDKNEGWTETRRVSKKQIDEFPNISFADPRIKLADMTGDGLQDIVQIHSGSIRYWPNLGYGNFGKPVTMKNSPRFPMVFDPARVLLGDIDGDGQADLIFIDAQKITFWINKSGNGWSEPIEITGTPFVPNVNGIRIADIYGSGVSGVLYSFDVMTSSMRHQWYFLDLTGGTKPYLLHEMDNNMGSLTRVNYLPSTRYYLKDQYGLSDEVLEAAPPELSNPSQLTVPYPTGIWKPDFKKRSPWKTTLPFPVQVVSKVEVIDQISLGKLATRYVYHHGYWDGGEREFRGFGRVDQKDTETFQRFNAAIAPPAFRINPQFNSSFVSNDGRELTFQQTGFEHYSPPVEMRNWFHLGPVGDEFGDWEEVNFANEYWSNDPSILKREQETINMLKTLPRRAKRDALRVLRGGNLRTELYALTKQQNGEYISGKPYTITETQYGLKNLTPAEFANANDDKQPKNIFFSFSFCSRTTQWERGNDPMTQLSFSGDFDQYGQARKQLAVALPRGIQPPYDEGLSNLLAENGGGKMLSTLSYSTYAQRDVAEHYMVDRVCRSLNFEVIPQNENAFELKERLFGSSYENLSIAIIEGQVGKIIGCTFNYYDGAAFIGLPYGQLGNYGALVNSETLITTEAIINDAYDVRPQCFEEIPDWVTDYPDGFDDTLQGSTTYQKEHLGYIEHDGEVNYPNGWYAPGGKTKYDFHVDTLTAKGLVIETHDAFDNKATLDYDDYKLFPVSAKQWLNGTDYLETIAEFDYRVLQANKITDPNGNRSVFGFSPLGLMKQSGIIGKLNADEGDIISEIPLLYEPSVRMEYDFLAFYNNQQPVWVKTIQREKHWQQDPTDDSPTIVKVEYTDGFGRLLQTRTQAEDVIFGNSTFGDSGLPETQTENADAVGVQRSSNALLNVVVSGWQIYNNKGKVVQKYEPFFSKGFSFSPPSGEPEGAVVRMFYDPRGQVVKTINPDNTMQLVLFGKPDNITAPPLHEYVEAEGFTPTPWESYTYDANDLAQVSHEGQTTAVTGVSTSHYFTPKNIVVDAIGRILKTTERVNGDEVVMKYEYDIRKNLLKTTDALGRIVSINKYNLANQVVKSTHLDAGIATALTDATGKPVQVNDAKGAIIISAYDTLNRPIKNWAKDKTGEDFTQRQYLIYGDSAGLSSPEDNNLLGKIYKHYDEAGLTKIENYDFKGSVTEKKRQVIKDSEILSVFGGGTVDCYRVNWDPGIEDFDTYAANLLDSTIYQTNMEYDALNRATKITYPADIFSVRKEVTPVFNNAGALEKITSGGTDFVKHIAYNAKGQKIVVAWGNDVMIRYAYDPNTFRLNRVKAEKYIYNQSGNTHTYEYDSGTTRYDQKYKYDFVGNIVNVTDKTPDCGITGSEDELFRQFEYDALYRLIFANGREMNNQSENYLYADAPKINNPTASDCRKYERRYEYDLMGNIQKLKHRVPSDIGESFTRAFEYESGTNHLEEINNGQPSPTTYSEFTYDEAGNTTGNNSDRVYEWDYANRMRSFYIQASGSITKYTHYLYDAGGNRLKKLTRTQEGDWEAITYIDGIFEYHLKDSGGDTEEKNYNHIQGGIEERIGGYSDDMADTTVYHITDYLGSATIRLTDAGSIIDREEFYPFGDSSVRTFTSKRYRFCGKEKDSESGLYYFGGRYYAAWTCRFLSVDPMTPKTPNLTPYHYASNNPVMRIDPTGLQDKPVDAGGGGGGEAKSDSGGTVTDTITIEKQMGSIKVTTKIDTVKKENGEIHNVVNKSFEYPDGRTSSSGPHDTLISKPVEGKAETEAAKGKEQSNPIEEAKPVTDTPAAETQSETVKESIKSEQTNKIISSKKSEQSTSKSSPSVQEKTGGGEKPHDIAANVYNAVGAASDVIEAGYHQERSYEVERQKELHDRTKSDKNLKFDKQALQKADDYRKFLRSVEKIAKHVGWVADISQLVDNITSTIISATKTGLILASQVANIIIGILQITGKITPPNPIGAFISVGLFLGNLISPDYKFVDKIFPPIDVGFMKN